MREIISFPCNGDLLAGTLDPADGKIGLLIVSGGNEIRGGAFGGQASMAQHFSALGIPVFRFDRRGVGDSEGVNRGYDHAAEDIHAAIGTFRRVAPQVNRIVALGNCDAATALMLHAKTPLLHGILLANPWTIDPPVENDTAPTADASVIRARYWARMKNPRTLLDLVSGKIDLSKLASGLKNASKPLKISTLGQKLAGALAHSDTPIGIVVAERDTTALAFMAAWNSPVCESARRRPNIQLASYLTASHSFADAASRAWLYAQVEAFISRLD